MAFGQNDTLYAVTGLFAFSAAALSAAASLAASSVTIGTDSTIAG